LRVSARNKLRADSDLMLDQIRSIDNRRITGDALTSLSVREMAEVEEYLKITLGFETV
jgi:mRNA-degrading endonuclease toxin of MazEF toxin-antitoxin module